MEEALDQQEALTEFADANQLVVKTGVLEKVTDGWPGEELRRAQAAHAGTIWLSEAGRVPPSMLNTGTPGGLRPLPRPPPPS